MGFKDISKKIRWSAEFCKLCNLCVEFCPKKTLEIKDSEMIEKGDCIKCNMCERVCPDLAIKVLRKPGFSGITKVIKKDG